MSPSKLRSDRGEGTVRLAIGISALLLGAWTVNPGFAQEAPEFLLKLSEPVRPVPAETVTRDDLRELPTPRLDKLSEAGVTVTVIQGDPLCLPGDDPWRINSRPRPARAR
jgi:hypothetical protein